METHNLRNQYGVFFLFRMTNDDERNLGVKSGFDHLHFESRFESGNLRKVIKVYVQHIFEIVIIFIIITYLIVLVF